MKAITNNSPVRVVQRDKPFQPSTHCMLSDGTFGTTHTKPNIESVTVNDFSLQNILKLPYVQNLKQADALANFDSVGGLLEHAASVIENETIIEAKDIETISE